MIKNIIAGIIGMLTMFVGICYVGWQAVEFNYSYLEQASALIWWVLLSVGAFQLQRKTLEIGGLVD